MCGDPNRYCPEGSFAPITVRSGYFSIGNTESTRYNEMVAPVGHFASLGLLYTCAAGFFGASVGLSTHTCSGPCNINGYYCPGKHNFSSLSFRECNNNCLLSAGSTSPFMFACGGDDFYCPAQVAAPIHVSEGFYTADYRDSQCPPGMWRNWTLSVDVSIGHESVMVTESSVPDCQLCPNNTYKYLR
jgi:hypothetical protein